MAAAPTRSDIRDRLQTWRLDTQGLWSEAWGLMKREYGVLAGASVVAGVINGVLLGLNLWLKLGYLTEIPSVLVQVPLMNGLWMMGVRIARGARVEFSDVLQGFGRYWTVVAIGLVVHIAMIVIMLPMQLMTALRLEQRSPMLGCCSSMVALFVFVPLMFFVTIRFWLAPMLCLDERVERPGVRDSLVASWVLGGQSFWPMLGVAILTGLMMLGSLPLAGVGLLLLGLPLAVCVFGVMYTRIVDSAPRPRCPDCGCDLSASATLVCPVCGVKGNGAA